ncbi:hypothetical protein JKA73_08895 [Myxococcus xanthus]|nr:hypothetical protein JKA73_08895 [Myxococcus xanthus]
MRTATRRTFEREETHVHLVSRHLRVAGDAAGPDVPGGGACLCCECAEAQANDYVRLPGLFRRWEIQHVVDTDADFNIEAAGSTEDGTELFSVYRRERHAPTTHCQKEE